MKDFEEVLESLNEEKNENEFNPYLGEILAQDVRNIIEKVGHC